MDLNLDRRGFLASAAAATLPGWLGRLATAAPDGPRPKACILLFMHGGPSHIDTFDPKPDAPADVRGNFRPINTAVPGIQISEVFSRSDARRGHHSRHEHRRSRARRRSLSDAYGLSVFHAAR